MKTSTERILTTHAGSLPRPKPLLDLISGARAANAGRRASVRGRSREGGRRNRRRAVSCRHRHRQRRREEQAVLHDLYAAPRRRHRARSAVAEKGRDMMQGRDRLEHPDFPAATNFSNTPFPGCVGELPTPTAARWSATSRISRPPPAKARPAEAFMTAPSPGILTRFIINLHYPTKTPMWRRSPTAMRPNTGDRRSRVPAADRCPDLGSAAQQPVPPSERRRIPPHRRAQHRRAQRGDGRPARRPHAAAHLLGQLRGPAHARHLPLTKIIDIAFKARPQAISIEAANPRHEHEWEDLKAMRIPDDKMLIPGVIDSTTNFVEHPRLVAQRICRYAESSTANASSPASIAASAPPAHRARWWPTASSGRNCGRSPRAPPSPASSSGGADFNQAAARRHRRRAVASSVLKYQISLRPAQDAPQAPPAKPGRRGRSRRTPPPSRNP